MLTAKDRSEIKQLIVEAIREERAQKFANSLPAVDITARATEVFGSADKAIRWLQSPVRALGDKLLYRCSILRKASFGLKMCSAKLSMASGD
jgi:uncharacterized protein (DUF2384 family)